MKRKRILALALAVVTSFSVFTATAFAEDTTDGTQQTQTEDAAQTGRRERPGKKKKVEAPENAIGKDAAKEAALKDAGLTAEQTDKVKSRVSKTEDGTIVYKVRFSADDRYFIYEIDAVTGNVISSTEQSAEEHAAEIEKARAEKAAVSDAAEDEQSAGRKHGRPGAADAADNGETGTASRRSARGRVQDGGSTADAAEQSDPSTAG